MNSSKFLITLIALVSLTFCFAEEAKDMQKALGLHFGTASGNGYSYRKYFGAESEHALQFVFGAMTTGDSNVKFVDRIYNYDNSPSMDVTKKGWKTSTSLGLSYINVLVSNEHSKFYFVWGGSYLYSRRNDYVQHYVKDGNSYYYDALGSPSKIKKNFDRWTIGVGPGFELFADKNLRLSIEIPITVNNKSEVIPYIPQVGIYYYFN